jgi:hypothetical protein
MDDVEKVGVGENTETETGVEVAATGSSPAGLVIFWMVVVWGSSPGFNARRKLRESTFGSFPFPFPLGVLILLLPLLVPLTLTLSLSSLNY